MLNVFNHYIYLCVTIFICFYVGWKFETFILNHFGILEYNLVVCESFILKYV